MTSSSPAPSLGEGPRREALRGARHDARAVDEDLLDVAVVAEEEELLEALEGGLAGVHAAEDPADKAKLARVLRLETMVNVRSLCDKAEAVCPAKLWSLPTYTDLLFLDASS